MSNGCYIACYHCQQEVYLDKIGWEFAFKGVPHPQLPSFLTIDATLLDNGTGDMGTPELVEWAKREVRTFLAQHEGHLTYIHSDDSICHFGNHEPLRPVLSPEGTKLGNFDTWLTVVAFDSRRHPLQLAIGGRDGKIQLWHLERQCVSQTLQGHEGWISTLQFSPDQETLISSSADCQLKFWHLPTAQVTQSFLVAPPYLEDGNKNYIADGIVTLSQNSLLSRDRDNLKLWDLTPLKLQQPQYSTYHTKLALHPTGQQLLAYSAHYPAAYSRDGKRIATTTMQREGQQYFLKAEVMDVESQEQVRDFTVATTRGSEVRALTFSPDRRYLACAVDEIQYLEKNTETKPIPDLYWLRENVIKICDCESGEIVKTLTGHLDLISDLAFDPTGLQLASCDYGGAVILWQLDLPMTPQTPPSPVSGMVKGLKPSSFKPHPETKVWEVEYELPEAPSPNSTEAKQPENQQVSPPPQAKKKQPLFEQLAELFPYSARKEYAKLHWDKADQAFEAQDMQTALENWYRAIEWDQGIAEEMVYEPRTFSHYYGKYRRRKLWESAIAQYQNSEKTPEDAHLLIGNYLFSVNSFLSYLPLAKTAETIAASQVEITQNSQSRQSYLNLGLSYALQGQWQPALENLATYTAMGTTRSSFIDGLVEFIHSL